jgi:hypothetical protein
MKLGDARKLDQKTREALRHRAVVLVEKGATAAPLIKTVISAPLGMMPRLPMAAETQKRYSENF